MELGCSREDSFRVPTVPGGLCLSAPGRGGGKEQSAMLCSWARVLLPYNQGRGAGDAARLLSLRSVPGVAIPAPPAALPKPSGVTRRAGTASSTRASWKASTLPHCAAPLNQQASLPRLLPALLSSWAATLTNTSTLKEPQSLGEYFGLQLVRQEGVSNTGNAHPIGSGWLHTAPLPSARKESASATLPPHMVTYNTSAFSFSLLSLMCLIF